MKKLRLLAFFLSLALLVVVSSCSDDEAPSPTLIGYWELQTIEIRNGGDLNGLYNPIFTGLQSQQIEFLDQEEFVQTLNLPQGLSGELEGTYVTNAENTELTLQFSSVDEVYEMDLQLDQVFLTRRGVTLSFGNPEDPDGPPIEISADVTYRYVKLY